jgi:hypothetical protein
MKSTVVVKHLVEGVHHWPDAPDEVSFLRDKHRHVFHTIAHVSTISDREVEFFLLKKDVQLFFEESFSFALGLITHYDFGSSSCESLASRLFQYLKEKGYNVIKTEIWEDGENGAIVTI